MRTKRANGITTATITVVRQSAIKINTINVTNNNSFNQVTSQSLPPDSPSPPVIECHYLHIFRKHILIQSSILSFRLAITSPDSPFRMTTIPCTTSFSSIRPTCPKRGGQDSCTSARFFTRIGCQIDVFHYDIFSIHPDR